MSAIEREIVLREFYNEKAGLVSAGEFDDPNQPYVLVKLTKAEGLRELWPMRDRIRQFKIYEIQKHYGYTLSEFFELPRPMVDVILEEQRSEEEKLRAKRLEMERKEKQKQRNQGGLEAGHDFPFMFKK